MNTSRFPAIERRFTPGLVELRAAEGGRPAVIAGYGAVYGKRSENMGYGDIKFFEVIEPGAFDDVLEDDVRCLFNHDSNLILGRIRSKTLRIFSDQKGLGYECQQPDTSYARDLVVSLQRKDVDQSSFAFSITRDGQKFVEENGIITRYIKKVARLFDVSPVTYPAYPDATSEARGIAELISAARDGGLLARDSSASRHDHMRRRLDLLDLEAGVHSPTAREIEHDRRRRRLALTALE